MKEKVYTIPCIWDMTIVEGIADYQGCPHHFLSLDPDEGECGFFSDRYKLTPLITEVFELEMKIWSQWLHWLDMYEKGTHIPHANDYGKVREKMTYDQVKFDNPHFTEFEKKMAEQDYQRKLIIADYLQTATPLLYQVRGDFQGSTDFSSNTEGLFVEWSDLPERITKT